MKILIAGDSTAANCPTHEYPMSGWGAQLAPHVFTWAAVHNYAKGGASTESFRAEGLWHQLMPLAGVGDVVLIQFGHNDQKFPHLAARTGYADNLRRMVAEVKSKGAAPILCTSVARRLFSGGKLEPTLGEYPAVVREVAAEQGTLLIDLNAWTSERYMQLGEEGSREMFVHLEPGAHGHWAGGLEDNTHFSVAGAKAVAAYVAGQLALLGYGPRG
ncbi:rhamnogalacturonan acetylesterase [Pseudarthrobacter sp. J75]|uniref:rhamnogalacturonan acetylesterase n=1 Tax=unclassified Pseudarthrobacter TaxID=2647000 RepID=UPI002E7FB550|nr:MULTISPECIES: rhamnogalacturonan acetylesterase [unclassified Pseudarthrobacter]MEE2522217.1 rhamnogalacturonan acetylesterase [Pseudarthrobacter sp. J47]MEE2528137.1 rhamnogalacturonan acetylesterase [Pseudarthrobacter sp. J75]MEE2567839.1 rhamnogalacturonan acetylesterase [Pseudarthrobacter sp. J64]